MLIIYICFKKTLFFTNYDNIIVNELRDSLKLMDEFIELITLSKTGQYKISSKNRKREIE